MVLLQEVREAVEATWSGALTSDEAMKDVIAGAKRQASRDRGLGDQKARELLVALLDQLLPVGKERSKSSAALQQILDRISTLIDRSRAGYFQRWIELVGAEGVAATEVEVIARLLVAHLTDEGLHRSHLHGWLSNLPEDAPLGEVLQEGRQMLLEPPRQFTFLVSVVSAHKDVRASMKELWREADDYLRAFEQSANPKKIATPRLGAGAIEWSCTARDPHGAMVELLAWQQRVVVRTQLGLGVAGNVTFGPHVIDVVSSKVRTPREDLRPLRIPTIQRNRLFSGGLKFSDQLDGAIELLASHTGAAKGASVASVWAAAEGLLGRPGGKGTDVADRLADIVACSFPRAEVTALARSWAGRGGDDLAARLTTASSDEQARMMADQLIRSGDPGFIKEADQAAVARYVQLSKSPAEVLARVRSYYSAAFRRLYYQRNFVMHAARFDSVSLSASARTAPALVAAALDRIINAQQGEVSMSPLQLAARAENELSLVGTAAARPLHALLD
ncbi:hypothetical protein [Schumannella soli]|uniref:Uncharacterized protein n=1 Tax=Schumannella soli TaxID=2590779 RepID=A0A506XZ90_9MICO|nr:hypothetical protein [Schumannella soli]TPW78091.1 hypothetical protein FJ657_05550 [Schumannella soli]